MQADHERIDALEKLVNELIASTLEPKHCPFCREKLAELDRRLTDLQTKVLQQNLTFGSD